MYIQITLLSDICASSGTGYAGSIDTDINYDDKTGLPYVPSKRIKGCLREAGLDIISAYSGCPDSEKAKKALFHHLFGERGKEDSGKLKISDGLLNYNIIEGENKHLVLDELTTLRSGTRMKGRNETCAKSRLSFPILKAEDQSLRVVRVLNRGEILFSRVQCHDCTDDHLDFLEVCCVILRNMGSNRTRGWGEVKCVFERKEDYPIAEASIPYDFKSTFGTFALQPFNSDTKSASYQILLTEPVISSLLSGGVGCEGYLPGSMLLGYFAGLWVKANSSDPDNPPHRNPEFRRLFLEGSVIFSSAYPSDAENLYYPAPITIKTNKTRDIVHDDINAAASEEAGKNKDATTKLGGYIHKSGKRLNSITPAFTVALHHARPYDRSVGHAEEGKNARDGAFFTYTALAPAQLFCGNIIGTENDLAILKVLLPESESVIRLGRSRSAQYGNAKFHWYTHIGEEADRYISIKSEDNIRVIIRSPLILCNDDGTIIPCPQLLADKIGLDLDQAFVSETLVAGYNAKWLLPRQQMSAIQAGSVIVLKNNTGKCINIEREQFIGLRKGEGFGHIYIEKIPDTGGLLKPNTISDIIDLNSNINGKSLTERIEVKLEKRRCEQEALNDTKINSGNAPSSAQLGRLLGLLRGKRSVIDSPLALRKKLNEKWKDTEKLAKMKAFCRLADDNDNPTNGISEWELYKVWLLAAISKVQLERRANQ